MKKDNKEIVNLLLGMGADINIQNSPPPSALPLPMGHPQGYVPPKRPTQDSLENQMGRLGEIEVLPAVNVRKRSAAERERDGSVRLPPAAKIKKRDLKG